MLTVFETMDSGLSDETKIKNPVRAMIQEICHTTFVS